VSPINGDFFVRYSFYILLINSISSERIYIIVCYLAAGSGECDRFFHWFWGIQGKPQI